MQDLYIKEFENSDRKMIFHYMETANKWERYDVGIDKKGAITFKINDGVVRKYKIEQNTLPDQIFLNYIMFILLAISRPQGFDFGKIQLNLYSGFDIPMDEKQAQQKEMQDRLKQILEKEVEPKIQEERNKKKGWFKK